jgi:hypothetical protein
MALAQLNGNVVEHASLLAFYENYFPQIKHIEGKGVTERYITDQDPTKVDSIDIPRLLPMKAHARKIGGASNGGWINTRNANGGYSPEAVFYTVQLNRVFDEDVLLPYTLLTSSKLEFKTSVNKVITDSFAQTINGYTWAGQFKKFFDDNAVSAGAVFTYNGTTVTACKAFQDANSTFLDGDMSIGALAISSEEKQAFISPALNTAMKDSYATNGANLAIQINATGFMNPFTQSQSARVDTRTGLLGLYDGVVLTLFNNEERKLVYEILGLTSSDTDELAILNKIQGMIVYAGTTVRGVAGLSLEVNKDPYNNSTYVFAPYAKFGVGVLSGKSIKMIANGDITDANLATVKAKIAIADVLSAVGDGTNYSTQSHR